MEQTIEIPEGLNEKSSSCEISISTKGVFSGKIKVYGDTGQTAREDAIAQAEILESYLKKKNGGA